MTSFWQRISSVPSGSKQVKPRPLSRYERGEILVEAGSVGHQDDQHRDAQGSEQVGREPLYKPQSDPGTERSSWQKDLPPKRTTVNSSVAQTKDRELATIRVPEQAVRQVPVQEKPPLLQEEPRTTEEEDRAGKPKPGESSPAPEDPSRQEIIHAVQSSPPAEATAKKTSHQRFERDGNAASPAPSERESRLEILPNSQIGEANPSGLHREPPIIEISIGRIEIRPQEQPVQTRPAYRPFKPAMSLDDYLNSRNEAKP